MLKFITHYTINAMKTITLTDEQFDTLFEYVDDKVTTIVDASVDYLNESDWFDTQTFDNLFVNIIAAKETYLPWKQHQKKKWLLDLWKRSLTFYQLAN